LPHIQKNQSPSQPEAGGIDILGIRIDNLSKKDILGKAQGFFASDWPHQFVTASSLFILEAQKNSLLKKVCSRASLVIPDSSGISWAAQKLKYPLSFRYPGIDLAYDLCSLAELSGHRVFLLGGKPGVAEKAAQKIASEFPYLVIGGIRDGFFKESEIPHIIKSISNSKSRLILVGLGMPKQDLWIHEHLAKLPPGIYVGVGGTFDIWSGRLKRAPKWVQKSGVEWLYRLGQEPSRLRRILQLPRFALKILQR